MQKLGIGKIKTKLIEKKIKFKAIQAEKKKPFSIGAIIES